MKAHLDAVMAESGIDVEILVGEATEKLVQDDFRIMETERRLNRPIRERLGHDPDEMVRFVEARVSGKSLPAPDVKPLSRL